MEIYSGNTSSGEPEKSINKFKEIAYGAKFRKDGKLIVSGCADGIVRVFTRWAQELRSLRGHKGEVWFTQFSQNMTDIMSAGDDTLIVIYFSLFTFSIIHLIFLDLLFFTLSCFS